MKKQICEVHAPKAFTVTKATVLCATGTDKIILETDLPLGVYPYEGYPQTVQLDVSKGMGVQYVRENFGLEPEVIAR